MDKVAFFEHIASLPHYQHGSSGICEMCGKYLPTWNVECRGIGEPTIILCEACKTIPNVIKIIQDKRHAVYPALSGLDEA